MKLAWAVLVVGAGLVLLAGDTAGQTQTEALEARGQAAYAEQRCALCHSVGGEGNAKGPLDGVGSRVTAEDLERWLVAPKEMTAESGATRKPPMRAYPSLSPEDREAMVAYMLSLKEE
jgi:mono/diheme cytochrome c family protein